MAENILLFLFQKNCYTIVGFFSSVICTDGWCSYYTVRTDQGETLDTEAGIKYIKNISSIYTEKKDKGGTISIV